MEKGARADPLFDGATSDQAGVTACGERSRAAVGVSVSYPALDCEEILRLRKGNARKMDRMNDLTTGAKIVLGATIAFLIVSFFSWFHYTGPGKDEL